MKTVSVCRFCVRRLESADHLLLECEELAPTDLTTFTEFEERCVAIARQIFASGE